MIRLIKYSIGIALFAFVLHEVLIYLQEMAENEASSVPETPATVEGSDAQPSANDVKVVMIGATGATGKYVFAELVKDKRFSKITAIGRRPASIPEDFEGFDEINLEEQVQSGRVEHINDVDLNKELNKETVGKHFEGKDVFISTFGTTRKTAGSAAEFRRIDQGINVDMAKVAKEMNVPFYSLMSSQGANANSWFLYLQVKGQIEEEGKKLGFDKTSIWRPGMLERGKANRFVEKLAMKVMSSIATKTVAKAIVKDVVTRLPDKSEDAKKPKVFDNAGIHAYVKDN